MSNCCHPFFLYASLQPYLCGWTASSHYPYTNSAALTAPLPPFLGNPAVAASCAWIFTRWLTTSAMTMILKTTSLQMGCSFKSEIANQYLCQVSVQNHLCQRKEQYRAYHIAVHRISHHLADGSPAWPLPKPIGHSLGKRTARDVVGPRHYDRKPLCLQKLCWAEPASMHSREENVVRSDQRHHDLSHDPTAYAQTSQVHARKGTRL